jgi:hypothetical protein
MSFIASIVEHALALWLEIAPYLLLGILVAGILHIFLSRGFISKQLGKRGLASILKAVFLGIPLPVCSCGVIPLASSLKKDGADESSVLAFLVSTPTTGIDSIMATYSLMGPVFAVFRPLAAAITGIVVGLIDHFSHKSRNRPSRTGPSSNYHKTQATEKVKEFLRYTFYEIPQDIGKWLIIGTLIGGLISALMPAGFLSSYLKFPFDFLAIIIFALPLYVCATGSIPIAVSLIGKGLSVGAALTFLIVGPATNAITLSFVRAKLGRRSFYSYLISIVFIGFLLGWLFNYWWRLSGSSLELLTPGARFLPYNLKLASAIILFMLVVYSILGHKRRLARVDLQIYVPDLHCQHCKLTLEGVLSQEAAIKEVSVDIKRKTVNINGNPDKSKIIDIIKKAGYHPKLSSSDNCHGKCLS